MQKTNLKSDKTYRCLEFVVKEEWEVRKQCEGKFVFLMLLEYMSEVHGINHYQLYAL